LFVEDLYKFESSLNPQGEKYKLRIFEFEQEHSYFSNFELIRAVHPKKLEIGVINNKIVFYKNTKKPKKITSAEDKDLSQTLNKKGAFNGKAGDSLKLKFENIAGQNNILVWQACLRTGYPRVENMERALKKFKTDQELDKFLNKMAPTPWKVAKALLGVSVAHVSLEDGRKNLATGDGGESGGGGGTGKWSIIFYLSFFNKTEKIGIIHPRENFSTGLMNLSPYLRKKKPSSLEIGLEWTNTHKLNFMGLAQLATSEEIKDIKIENLKLETMKHSHKKEVNKEDLEKGKVELIPGQFLELTFPYKKIAPKSTETISYLLKSKGYYKKA